MTWLSSSCNILKNGGNKTGAFIRKATQIIRTIGNAMCYFPGQMGKIGKAINHYVGIIDSFTGLLSNSTLKKKTIKFLGNVKKAYLQSLKTGSDQKKIDTLNQLPNENKKLLEEKMDLENKCKSFLNCNIQKANTLFSETEDFLKQDVRKTLSSEIAKIQEETKQIFSSNLK
jgi:hypothetical protein